MDHGRQRWLALLKVAGSKCSDYGLAWMSPPMIPLRIESVHSPEYVVKISDRSKSKYKAFLARGFQDGDWMWLYNQRMARLRLKVAGVHAIRRREHGTNESHVFN